EIITGLAQRGVKKIFCEKPLTRTMEEARKIKEICEKENVVLGIGYKMRFERSFMISKAIVEEGKIGKLQFLTFNYFQSTPSQPWYLESGVVHEILSHTIDLSNWFAGNPHEVFCEVQNFQGGSKNDRAYLTITYQNGVVAIVNGGWIKEYPDLPGKQGRNICFQLVGEKGYLAGIRGWKLLLCKNTHEQNITIEPSDPIEEELKAFFETLSQDQPPPLGLKEGLLTQAVIESALKSAINGHREKILIE
ncbi:MAG: Gfo/Idh/MocA family protein, partial [Candidatus Caldatribacteriaceae bacterium]